MLAMAWGYREQYGLNTIYLIPANLYGPRDNFDLETGHVIPALIRKFAEAKNRDESSVLAWGTGQASREFLYVEDAADAIVGAAELYGMAEPVNLGTGHEVQIAELVELIAEQLSFGGEIVWDSTKPDGQPRRRLDTGRALAEFGFQAQTSLRQGLIATIDWYLKEW
jgi:nucleoside-diphosphate-sugar epimerase